MTPAPDHVAECAARTAFTRVTFRQNHVVSGAEQLEIVDVVDDRNAAGFQFPQNRWRKMVIDVPHMRDVRPEGFDHVTHFSAVRRGVDCTPGNPYFRDESGRRLEIFNGREMLVKSRRAPSGVGHGKQRDLVAAFAHPIHRVEQIRLGAAEPEVIFVAVKDSHGRWR